MQRLGPRALHHPYLAAFGLQPAWLKPDPSQIGMAWVPRAQIQYMGARWRWHRAGGGTGFSAAPDSQDHTLVSLCPCLAGIWLRGLCTALSSPCTLGSGPASPYAPNLVCRDMPVELPTGSVRNPEDLVIQHWGLDRACS